MSFTPRQQGIYRPLVKAAWGGHARGARCGDLAVKAAMDRWYRETLHRELGVWSSMELSPKADFADACAVFERLGGAGIYWQVRAMEGEAGRRWRWRIARVCAEHDLDESYARGIARQAMGCGSLPLLENLSPEQLRVVFLALNAQVRRTEASAAAEVVEEPF